MENTPKVPVFLTKEVTFEWNDRTWRSITSAMYADEMLVYIQLAYFPYDHESARQYIPDGGVFHVRGKHSFRTYYVHKQAGGLYRLFMDTTARDYCNGQVYQMPYISDIDGDIYADISYESARRLLNTIQGTAKDEPKDVIAAASRNGVAVMRGMTALMWVTPSNPQRTRFRVRIEDKYPQLPF